MATLRTLKTTAVAAVALVLGGCVTGYTYRSGHGGDYYYGDPSVDYRYHYDSYSPYFWGGYGYYGYRRPGYYGYYGGGYGPYVGYPYYGYPYRYPYWSGPYYGGPHYGYGGRGGHHHGGAYLPCYPRPVDPHRDCSDYPLALWRKLDGLGGRNGNAPPRIMQRPPTPDRRPAMPFPPSGRATVPAAPPAYRAPPPSSQPIFRAPVSSPPAVVPAPRATGGTKGRIDRASNRNGDVDTP